MLETILRRARKATRPPDRTATPAVNPYAKYRSDPLGFAADVLGVTLTPDQQAALRAALEPPYRVMVKSGHNIGKTFLCSVLVVWWYYTRNPAIVITTAPTERDVCDLLWTEIRLLVRRAKLPDHLAPAAPGMYDPADPEEHYAKGFTARKGESFQGRHRPNMLFVFDEAEGVEATYWKTTNTMFQPDGSSCWFAILNPTTTTSQSYQEEQAVDGDGDPKWRTFSISSLNHPNVLAAVKGEPIPIPNAVSLGQVEDWVAEYFEPLPSDEADPFVDVEFPVGSGQWYRPGPDGEGRVLGRRPSAGTYGVWSEQLWTLAVEPKGKEFREIPAYDIPEIGCDVARFGDDRTEIHARTGSVSLSHEDHGGWDTVKTADRLMRLAYHLAAQATARRDFHADPLRGTSIPIKVDDTGVGGGVTDILRANGYNAVPVNAGSSALDPDRYVRMRDELWFTTALLAKAGKLDLSRLGAKRLAKLKTQAMQPKWTPTPTRQRKVESKEDLKKRLGRSPDGMDAVNLAYLDTTGSDDAPEWIDTGRPARRR
jgi:hypothetical protein